MNLDYLLILTAMLALASTGAFDWFFCFTAPVTPKQVAIVTALTVALAILLLEMIT